MYKKLKEKLYFLKQWYHTIFLYPKEQIDIRDSLDYDIYWKGKRGRDVGVLSDWQRIRADIVVKNIDPHQSVTIGDIACGEGSILKYIGKHRNVSKAIGYDQSEFVLDKAKAIGIETQRINLNDPDDFRLIEPADYFLLLEILEHIPESERLLARAFSQARKGVFFSFPNTGYFLYRLRLLFGKFPRQWVTFPNEHLRFWTTKDLKWWMKAQGYHDYSIFFYKGIPLFSKLWPSLFAAAFVVFVYKSE